jgi:diaminopimelate epimerase
MSAPVAAVGPVIEHAAAFPEGTNVEFAAVDGAEIRVRVWERGVGETQACGTGAAATVAVAHALGRIGPDVTVHLAGGPLRVELIEGVAWISGRADYVFMGSLLD